MITLNLHVMPRMLLYRIQTDCTDSGRSSTWETNTRKGRNGFAQSTRVLNDFAGGHRNREALKCGLRQIQFELCNRRKSLDHHTPTP